MLHSVPGLEHAQMMRCAYAIEYDCADPLQLVQHFFGAQLLVNAYESIADDHRQKGKAAERTGDNQKKSQQGKDGVEIGEYLLEEDGRNRAAGLIRHAIAFALLCKF